MICGDALHRPVVFLKGQAPEKRPSTIFSPILGWPLWLPSTPGPLLGSLSATDERVADLFVPLQHQQILHLTALVLCYRVGSGIWFPLSAVTLLFTD